MPIVIIASLIAFQVLLIFVHLAVYATMSAAFGIGGTAFQWLFIILAITFITSSVIVHWSRNRLAQWYYAFAAYWFGLVHFLFMGGVAFFIIENILNFYVVYVDPALIGGICYSVFFLIHLYGTWNSGRARVVRITMPLSSSSVRLPEYWRNHPLVFISDIHLGAIRGAAFTSKIVDKINAVEPAAVVIGGDLYDGVKCDAEAVIAPLRNLKTKKGVYYITGNHEYYGEFERYMAAIRDVGITILDNETVDVEGIRFTGVSFRETHKREDFQNMLGRMGITGGASATATTPTILVKHEPDNLDVAEQAGFSAGFFGHTHQGQIWPLSIITRQMYQGFDYGLKAFKKMQVYTSSGVGTWGPPLRIGTKSEIIVVQFV